jgi:hypothetical protein
LAIMSFKGGCDLGQLNLSVSPLLFVCPASMLPQTGGGKI